MPDLTLLVMAGSGGFYGGMAGAFTATLASKVAALAIGAPPDYVPAAATADTKRPEARIAAFEIAKVCVILAAVMHKELWTSNFSAQRYAPGSMKMLTISHSTSLTHSCRMPSASAIGGRKRAA